VADPRFKLVGEVQPETPLKRRVVLPKPPLRKVKRIAPKEATQPKQTVAAKTAEHPQYFLVLASLGSQPRCEVCSSLKEVDEKLQQAADNALPEDFRPFLFTGKQLAIVSDYGVARVVDSETNALFGVPRTPADAKDSLLTGQVFKEDDEFGGDTAVREAFDDDRDDLFSLD